MSLASAAQHWHQANCQALKQCDKQHAPMAHTIYKHSKWKHTKHAATNIFLVLLLLISMISYVCTRTQLHADAISA